MKRSCFWSLYSSHTLLFSKIEFTLSPYIRLLLIDLSALTICALVIAGFSTRSNLASRRFSRKLTKSTSRACFTSWSWLLEKSLCSASHATATISLRACIACFKGVQDGLAMKILKYTPATTISLGVARFVIPLVSGNFHRTDGFELWFAWCLEEESHIEGRLLIVNPYENSPDSQLFSVGRIFKVVGQTDINLVPIAALVLEKVHQLSSGAVVPDQKSFEFTNVYLEVEYSAKILHKLLQINHSLSASLELCSYSEAPGYMSANLNRFQRFKKESDPGILSRRK
nr:unnamed protein product [Callosobruchus chinensis]